MNEKLIIKPTEIGSVFKTLSTFPENLNVINAKEIWEQSKQGQGTTVAMIDTGVEKGIRA
ncbi:hypothetical protein [Virgibacillus proomii]|jgi:subtilisin family serine protease|uniref:hypothetical protein n=1 Tax=Virgibacillus proomii TaxID=84407 RepID=UPI000985D11A|nr:hypothetical protein [Virgibacillus proomii]